MALASAGSAAPGDAGSARGLCHAGLLQRNPIILGCTGGLGKHEAVLEKEDSTLSWYAPSGTKDLEVVVTSGAESASSRLRRLGGSSGGPPVSLEMRCEEPPEELQAEEDGDAGKPGKVLVGEHGLLNSSVRSASIDGATWSWVDFNESADTAVGVGVKGSLGCTAKVTLTNTLSSKAWVNVTYKWLGIEPCPILAPGCTTCPEDVCPPHGSPAICDGGYNYVCLPQEAPPLEHADSPAEAAKKEAEKAAAAETAKLDAEKKKVAAEIAEIEKQRAAQQAEEEEAEKKMADREQAEAAAEAHASEQSPTVSQNFQSRQLYVHIHGITFSRISSKSLETLSSKLAESLSQDLGIPVDNVQDLSGKKHAVSLSAGSLVVQSSIHFTADTGFTEVMAAAQSEATQGHIVAIIQDVLGEDSDAFSDGAASVGIDAMTFSSSALSHTQMSGGQPSSSGGGAAAAGAGGTVEEPPSTTSTTLPATTGATSSTAATTAATTAAATTTTILSTTTSTTTAAPSTTSTSSASAAAAVAPGSPAGVAGALGPGGVPPNLTAAPSQAGAVTLPPQALRGAVTQYPGQVPPTTPLPAVAAPQVPGQVPGQLPAAAGYATPMPGVAGNGAYGAAVAPGSVPPQVPPQVPPGAMASVHATGDVGAQGTSETEEEVGEPSWRTTAGVLIVGGGAMVCCISIGFLCLFMAVRRMASEHEEQDADRLSNLGSEFDRLPTGEAQHPGAQQGGMRGGGFAGGGGYEPLNADLLGMGGPM